MIMHELGQTLLQLARNAITARFGLPVKPAVDLPELHKMGATFVTLTQHDVLRGCIGSLEAWRPLLADVQENACNAAFRDPRFEPLTKEELPITRVEVSLLTPAEPMSFSSEADALAQLRPDIDGVIFTAGHHRNWNAIPSKNGRRPRHDFGGIAPPRSLVARSARWSRPVRPLPTRLPVA